MSEQPANYEFVTHPAHYNQHNIECWRFICWFPPMLAFAIKHLWREGDKPGSVPLEDLQKAAFYIELELQRLRDYPAFADYVSYGHPSMRVADIVKPFPTYARRAIDLMYCAVFGGELVDSVEYLQSAISSIRVEIHRRQQDSIV